jgi:hypothetical protein
MSADANEKAKVSPIVWLVHEHMKNSILLATSHRKDTPGHQNPPVMASIMESRA